MDQQISVSTEAVLETVTAQRDRALTDLAISQAACRQLSARVQELERESAGEEMAPPRQE